MRSILFGIFKYLSWVLAAIICLFFLSEDMSLTLKGGIMLGCIVALDILFNIDAKIMRSVKQNRRKSAENGKQRLSQAMRDASEAKKEAVSARREAQAAQRQADATARENERLKKRNKRKYGEGEAAESEKLAEFPAAEPIQAIGQSNESAAQDAAFSSWGESAADMWAGIKKKCAELMDKLHQNDDDI